MEYNSNWVRKELKHSDVKDRLIVTADMAEIMRRAYPGCKIPIRVLDECGYRYDFCLCGRKKGPIKLVFNARGWRAFIKIRGAKEGDEIRFRYEVNEVAGTEYHIQLFRKQLAEHPGL